jgi:hypothetical protein
VDQGLFPPLGERDVPVAVADRPEAARTARSEASSIRRRILVTDRNTPGSMGGGAGLEVDRRMVSAFEGGAALLLPFMGGTFEVKLLGSKLSTRRDSSSSIGS